MTVIIGMDPHKRSATIEIIDPAGTALATGRYGTDNTEYTEMLTAARKYADRVWAIEGCNGIGRHIAHRLVHDGETVIDVPAKLSAQIRVFATGNGRKTDPVDAHSVAMAALRAPNLHRVQADSALIALGMLADRRDELGRARTDTVNRLHRLLLELLPGGAKKFLTATQARKLVATVKPRDPAGKVRRRLVVESIGELETIDRKTKAADKELRQLVGEHGATLTDLYGIGAAGAARLLADVGDIHRFRDRNRFASWNSHRTAGRLFRPAATPSALARRKPQDQPSPAHHGHRSTTPSQRRAHLFRPAQSRGQDLDGSDASLETAAVECRLRAHAR